MHRAKIAIIHPQIIVGGGSEACALWTIEALKKDYDVSLISTGKINLDELNECYGTDIKKGDIAIITLTLSRLFKKRFATLRGYKLARFCKKIAPEFDVMISTHNVMDFGKIGIQFIADFSFDDKLRRIFNVGPQGFKKWFYQDSLLRKFYLKLGQIISAIPFEKKWKNNFTIANSKWEAKILKEVYEIDTAVIYPPVASEFPDISWDKKENSFLLIGRISPEKEIEKIIEILKKARKNSPDLHLHIIGGASNDNSSYAGYIKGLCDENNSWCFFEGPMYGQKKLDFIAQHKFGISGRANEPFGIAVAEMVKAGCIVFVPDGGGQTEIVDDISLIYEDKNDAVEKIKAVIKNKELQNGLRKNLLINSKNFSTEKFIREIKAIIGNFLKNIERKTIGPEGCSTPKELTELEPLFKRIIKSNKRLYRFLFRLKNNNRYIFALRNFWKDTDSLFKSIVIETCSTCNRKCSFCPVNADKTPKQMMSSQFFDKILKELEKLHFHGTVLLSNYGEPLLDKRLVSFAKMVKSALGSKIIIYTNGDFLTKKYLEELISDGVDLIIISQHDKEPSTALKNLFFGITPAEKKHLVFQVINKDTKRLSNRGGLVEIESMNGMHCEVQSIIVRADGEVSLCCNDYYGEVVLGNINKSDLIDVWNSTVFRRARNEIKKGVFNFPICKRCRGEILSSKKVSAIFGKNNNY